MTLLVMLATTSVQAEQVDETVLTVVTEVPTVDGGQTSNGEQMVPKTMTS